MIPERARILGVVASPATIGFYAFIVAACGSSTSYVATPQTAEAISLQTAMLVQAVEAGDVTAVKRLLEAGFDPNQRTTDHDKKLPLVQAVIKQCFPCAVALLDGKARVDEREGLLNGTALQQAAADAQEFVVLLVAHGADVSLSNNKGSTALSFATQRGSLETVRFLVEKGASLSQRGERGRPVALSAALSPKIEILRYLVEQGAAVDDPDSKGFTALMAAAAFNRTEAVQLLLARGANPNRVDEDGWSALCLAAERGATDAAHLLLKAGAMVDQVTNGLGETPLTIAARKGHVAVLDLLLSAGAKVDHLDTKGRSALARALAQKNWEIAGRLLNQGASLALVSTRELELARNAAPATLAPRLGPATVEPKPTQLQLEEKTRSAKQAWKTVEKDTKELCIKTVTNHKEDFALREKAMEMLRESLSDKEIRTILKAKAINKIRIEQPLLDILAAGL